MTMQTFFVPKRLGSMVVTALMACTVCSQASAMSIRELRALEKSDAKQGALYVQYYLVGVMEGVLETHAQAVRKGTAPTICKSGRRLEPRMAKSLFDSELSRNTGVYEADMPVELVMFNALASVYSCPA